MAKRIFLLAGLINLLFCGSCGKLNTKKEFALVPEVNEYFQFKNGSEWNYVSESDSTIKETSTIASFIKGKMVWDIFNQDFFEYFLVSNTDSLLKVRAVADDADVSRVVFLAKDTMYKISTEWYYAGGKFASGINTGDTVKLHDTKSVRGILYNNVVEFISAKGVFFKKIWVAKNIGIIRKEFRTGRVMLLKSYNLK